MVISAKARDATGCFFMPNSQAAPDLGLPNLAPTKMATITLQSNDPAGPQVIQITGVGR